jgi:hypothetical protein
VGSEDDVLNDEGLYEAVVFSSLLLCFPDTDLQSLSLLPPLLLCMSNQVILLYACNTLHVEPSHIAIRLQQH